MLSKTALFASLPLVLAHFVAGAAIPVTGINLKARAGPSGTVLYPPGGTVINNLEGTGDLHIQYQRVNESLSTGPAWTISIDLAMEDPTGVQGTLPIAYGVRATPPWADVIDVDFVPALGACGQAYNLVFTEHQWINGEPISFRAASPSIVVVCGPIQGRSTE